MAGEKCHGLGALEKLDLRMFVPLNGTRMAYKGQDHPTRKSANTRSLDWCI